MPTRNSQASVSALLRRSGIKGVLAGGLIACALVSGNASAVFGRGNVVFDPTQLDNHVREYRRQLQRWNVTAEHYRQQLISLGGMSIGPSAVDDPNADFPLVDPDYGLEDACRTQRGGDVMGTMKNTFRPDSNKDILEEQLTICRRIVRAENLKYNETVKYLNSLRARQRELTSLDRRRQSVGREQGKLQAVVYDVQRFEQSSKMDADHWQAMMLAYDNYIVQLNRYQQRLAQRALRGKQPDILTTVVQGAVLKSVLNEKKDND